MQANMTYSREDLLHMLGYMTANEVYMVLMTEGQINYCEEFNQATQVMQSEDFPKARTIYIGHGCGIEAEIYRIQDIHTWLENLPVR